VVLKRGLIFKSFAASQPSWRQLGIPLSHIALKYMKIVSEYGGERTDDLDHGMDSLRFDPLRTE
jgi:hypothetical protein